MMNFRVSVPAGILFRELDEESVLLNPSRGTYFSLNPTGTRIWQLCQEHASIQSVWEAMQREFDASADTLQSDLISFLDELASRGLVTMVTTANPVEKAP